MPKFQPNPPAPEGAIHELINSLRTPLPTTYLRAMSTANGGVGFVGKHYIALWTVEELIRRNLKYKVAEQAPELFLIGSNGGGEAYAFNTTSGEEAVYRVPFIGMATSEAELVAMNFDKFVPQINLMQRAKK